MFAYVKFVDFGASSCIKVVAIEDIKVKRSDVKNIDQNKLYKVKHPVTGKYSNAQVILVNDNNSNKKLYYIYESQQIKIECLFTYILCRVIGRTI